MSTMQSTTFAPSVGLPCTSFGNVELPTSAPHQLKNVVCLIVDGWHAGYLGAWGNAWLPTPALDQIASESFLLDRAIVNSTSLADQCEAIWHGDWRAAFDRSTDAEPLTARLASSGYHTVLVTDDVSVHQGADQQFAESILIDVPPVNEPANEPADDIESTRMARFFERLSSVIAPAPSDSLIWAHTRGLTMDWDAPYEFRARHSDDDDPSPPQTVEPPDFVMAGDIDPDVLLGLRQAYAGQIEVLDTCIGALVEQLDSSLDRETSALFLLSARGYPLGEHGVVGMSNAELFAESVSIPWMMRLPVSMAAIDRSDALVQPSDLMPTVLDLLGVEREGHVRATSLMPLVRGEATCAGDRLLVSGQTPRQQAFSTSSWHLASDATTASDDQQRLFAKPDDRWDQNDVAELCPDVVAAMNAHAAEMRKLGSQRDWQPLETLLSQMHT